MKKIWDWVEKEGKSDKKSEAASTISNHYGYILIFFSKEYWLLFTWKKMATCKIKSIVLLHKHKLIIHLKAPYISAHDFIDFLKTSYFC